MKRSAIFLLTLLLLASCKESEKEKGDPLPPGMRRSSGTVSGTVQEVLDGGALTFLRVDTGKESRWVAVNRVLVTKGEKVTVHVTLAADEFMSPTLNQKFENLVMGKLEGAEKRPAPPVATYEEESGEVVLPQVEIPRATGPNAKTIGEIAEQKAALADKTVEVRGQVVKSTPGVMGKNWIHLHDATSKTDLPVTTDASVNLGDVVVVTGVVRLNKEMGAGFSYPIIIEDAKISR